MSFWQFIESAFADRESKSDSENGEYYLEELLKEWQNVFQQDTNMTVFRLEALLNKNSGVSNSVEQLGFYARVVEFDSEIISKAFETAAQNKGENISLKEINFQLTGQSIPSQTAEKIEQTLVNGLDKTGELAKSVVDYAGDAAKALKSSSLDILKNLPMIIGLLLVAGIVYVIATGKNILKG